MCRGSRIPELPRRDKRAERPHQFVVFKTVNLIVVKIGLECPAEHLIGYIRPGSDNTACPSVSNLAKRESAGKGQRDLSLGMQRSRNGPTDKKGRDSRA
ncbi:MAG: hypothetical protein R6U96_13345 [Promethearchaeia archaeon]